MSQRLNTRRALAALAALTLAGCGSDASDATQAPPRRQPSERPSSSRSDYVDGRYRADGVYGNLPSSIGVAVTLTDDVITAVTVTPHATDPTSRGLQDRFAAAIPRVVVGRDIDEVEVSRLAGSSGTPIGFNAAIERIKQQAAGD